MDFQIQYFKVLDVRTSSKTDQRFQLKSIGVIRQDDSKLKYCDMCINPWYERELGLINDEGQWSVWDCVSKKRGGNKPQAMFQGKASRSLSKEYRSLWRIIWGKDVRSLIISDGRAIYCVNLKVSEYNTSLRISCLHPTDLCE